MLMSRRIASAISSVLAGLCVCNVLSQPAFAFDGATTDRPGNEKAPLMIFKNPQAALRAGIEGFRSGDVNQAIEAMKYAAAAGESLAAWKLGEMYANGDRLPHDDFKAYQYY